MELSKFQKELLSLRDLILYFGKGVFEIGYYLKAAILWPFRLKVIVFLLRLVIVNFVMIVAGQLLVLPLYFISKANYSLGEYLQISMPAGILVIFLGFATSMLGMKRQERIGRQNNP